MKRVSVPLRASLDPCDHPLDAAPAFGAVVKFPETTCLALFRCSLVACLHACLKVENVRAQCRCWRDAEDVVDLVDAAKVEHLGAAIVTVTAQQDFDTRPVGTDCAHQAAHKPADFLAAGPFGRTQTRR